MSPDIIGNGPKGRHSVAPKIQTEALVRIFEYVHLNGEALAASCRSSAKRQNYAQGNRQMESHD
jgi:hypothetical protein